MNYLCVILASTLLSILSASAQRDSSGIYKTTEDFQQRRLSYAINCKTEKHKINPNVFFKVAVVKVKHQGTTYTFKKSEVFGYRTCDGKEYKFVDDKEYSILNPTEPLIIYMYQHPAHSGKDVSKGMYQPQYFFSKDASSPLQDFTKANLKAAFPGNHKFHDALDANFKEDKDLVNYDNFHKIYKINRLYSSSMK